MQVAQPQGGVSDSAGHSPARKVGSSMNSASEHAQRPAAPTRRSPDVLQLLHCRDVLVQPQLKLGGLAPRLRPRGSSPPRYISALTPLDHEVQKGHGPPEDGKAQNGVFVLDELSAPPPWSTSALRACAPQWPASPAPASGCPRSGPVRRWWCLECAQVCSVP